MKYSNECRRLAQLIVNYRDSLPDHRLKSYKDLLVDLHPFDSNIKEKIVELMKFHHVDDVEQLTHWTIPIFPISPGMLALKGVKQSGNYKEILQELKETWKQSDFRATENELLNETLTKILQNNEKCSRKNFVVPPAFSLAKRKKLLKN